MDFISWQRAAKVPAALIILLIFGAANSYSQKNGEIKPDSIAGNVVDTVSFLGGEPIGDAFQQKEEKIHSPHKATFYSAILPGLGQAYNKKYWKIPLLYAGIGALGYAIHFNSTNYTKYKNAYRDFIIRDPGNKSYEKVIPVNLTIEQVEGPYAEWFEQALDNKRQYYKRYRDLCYIGMAAIYVLNLIDATVDAHFYNFDVSDDLSMKIRPVIMDQHPFFGNTLGIQLSLNF
jgi:hypothetical protein